VKGFMTEHDYIRSMFETLNNNVLSLAATVNQTNVKVEKLETRVDYFHEEVTKHFESCPVDDLREHTGRIDVEIAALRRPKSDSKISRPPAPAAREKTIQLLIVLAVVALGGIGLAAQLISQ
jgi:uncharacterized protein YehS (DUF1456 family)